ncbi:MAG TPA: aldo/keto reductase [Candidatus Binataceae bacterium]|nr:aldo/keto reductase [Candidatus Binataceae bacterium]
MSAKVETHPLGTTEMNVSRLGLGTSELGYGHLPLAQARALFNGALDAGLNLIDTGECYGSAEELIGQALSKRRHQYYLMSKCGHMDGVWPGNWEPSSIAASIERSLRRLRTDVIDVLFLHSCEESVLRQGDAIAALEKARGQGKIRYLGYSGDGAAARYAVECGAFAVLEISVSIADQEALELVLPLARARGIGVVAKRPIANAAWLTEQPANNYVRPYWERLRQLNYPFLHRPEAVATALRFTLSTPGIDTAIVGTTKPQRWRSNLELLSQGALPADVYQAIRERWQQVAQPDWVGQR